MKTSFTTLGLTLAIALRAQAYLSVPENALNVRHFHMVERGEGGEIVGRSFLNTFDLLERGEDDVLEARKCQTINACGTAGGCMVMAGQRYCDGVPWQKSFQEAVKQTGANGVTGLKIMAEGIGRGPVGMVVGAAKATAKAIIDAKKEDKKHPQAKPAPKKATPAKKETHKSAPKKETHKPAEKKKPAPAPKKKRDTEEVEGVLNLRSFEIVERDEELNFVERGEYSTFDLVARDEDGTMVTRSCELFDGDIACQ